VRYMLMICDDESDERGPLELVRDAEHVAGIDYLNREEIRLLDGVRLRPSTDATKVRSRNGETLISDGPFMESKEQIGGFALIECQHLEDARRGVRHSVPEACSPSEHWQVASSRSVRASSCGASSPSKYRINSIHYRAEADKIDD
jgi:hypothetical protein